VPLIELEFSAPPFDLQEIDAQFAEDVAYDVYDLTKFNMFMPNRSSLTALVIYIYGSGFIGGNKNGVYSGSNFPEDIREFLSNDIAVTTINYRLHTENETAGVLKSLDDSKRTLPFIMYIHNELNIDKNNIALYGSSVGAGTALWLASNDDLQDISHSNPVLRKSTRVQGVALNAAQASYDIENRWINEVFVDFSILWKDMIETSGEERQFQFYGV
jgi:acetyl esterase/lipase